MKINISLFTIIIIITYLLSALIFQQQIISNYLIVIFRSLMFLSAILIIFLSIKYLNKLDAIIINLFLLSILIVSFARNYAFWGSIFSITVSYCTAIFLIELKHKYSYRLLLIPFVLYFIFIVYRLTLDPNPNNVFVNSRNWISFYGILLLSPYYIVSISNSQNVKLYPSLLLLLLSFYSLGRMGMLSSFILFIGVLNYKENEISFIYFVILVPLFTYYFLNFVNKTDILRLYNFEDDRSLLWNYYFQNIGIREILIGMKIKDIHQSTGYFNLHSSYLHSIYYLGFVGYIFILVLLTSLFLQLYNMQFSLFLIFSSLLLRISTDVSSLWVF